MSEQNLMRYYVRLESLGIGEEIKISLADVSQLLFTSLRHARTLLNSMHQKQWLSWQPRSGRGQRSSLVLMLESNELKQRIASDKIRRGNYDKALEILEHDEVLFGQLLQSTSGASIREGRLHIQLTYKRAFEKLLPHHPQRSSERFLIRQLYACLVGNNEHGELEPQLAHHWDYNAYQWRFYLRPGLTFHNGSPINAAVIAELFSKLKMLPEYQQEWAHVERISAPNENQLLFQLSQPDLGFGGMLSGIKYAIQPPSQVQSVPSHQVVGSGPFMLSQHSGGQLRLQAFDRYFGCRALPDQVTIWLVDESSNGRCDYHVSRTYSDVNTEESQQSQVEYGCIFLLYNQNTESALNPKQRRYLSCALSPFELLQYTEQTAFSAVPAKNLLPIWQQILRPVHNKVPLPGSLSIAIYDYSTLQVCATAMKSILAKLGVELQIQVYTYRELMDRHTQLKEDLVLSNINLDDNRQSSAFMQLWSNPLFQQCINQQGYQWLKYELNHLRGVTPLSHYLEALEPIASTMITEYWMTPLFHHRQTVRFQGLLKNVSLTNWGWPDIKNVWSTD